MSTIRRGDHPLGWLSPSGLPTIEVALAEAPRLASHRVTGHEDLCRLAGAGRRNVIPPSLIGEYRDYPCSQCGAELVCHEPTRKKHWDGWDVVCPDCAVEMIDEHDGPTDVRQERDKVFERHWHKG